MYPEAILLVEITGHETDRDLLLNLLYDFGDVEIESDKITGDDDLLQKTALPEDKAALNKAADEASQLYTLINKIDYPEKQNSVNTEISINADSIPIIIADVQNFIKKKTNLEDMLGKARTALDYKVWLGANYIPEVASDSRFLYNFCGELVDKTQHKKFKDEFHGEYFLCSEPGEHRIFFILAADIDNKDEVKSKLEKYRWLPIKPRDEDCESIQRKLDDTESALRSYTKHAEEIKSYIAELRQRLERLEQNEKIYRTDKTFLVRCWTSQQKYPELKKSLDESSIPLQINISNAEDLAKAKQTTYEKIPSILKDIGIFSPFRNIVSLYSHPAYAHADPSIISGLTFMIMFGIMFADIGHGLVFILLGILLKTAKNLKFILTLGTLMITAGISAIIFGWIFGSFFGLEDVVHALWFNPFNNIQQFLLVGVCIGAFMLTTGIVINVMQNIRNGSIVHALFSEWGIFSLLFYWICLYLIYFSVRFGSFDISPAAVIAIVLLPLTFIVAGNIIYEAGSKNSDFAEIVFKPVDIILGLLSNTVSFVRVAAFGLTHIALMSAVYLLASMGESEFSRGSIALQGNILVIFLEGLIVSIQALRLQYYEFYSKFFLAGGRKFAPLKSD